MYKIVITMIIIIIMFITVCNKVNKTIALYFPFPFSDLALSQIHFYFWLLFFIINVP